MKTSFEFITTRIQAIGFALQGWGYVLRTQRNAWIHTLASAVVFTLAGWLNFSVTEWAILILTVAMVWVTEFINTAIETVVDLASPEIHPLAKVGKDVAAAGVLVAAVTSILIGLLLFGPHLLGLFE